MRSRLLVVTALLVAVLAGGLVGSYINSSGKAFNAPGETTTQSDVAKAPERRIVTQTTVQRAAAPRVVQKRHRSWQRSALIVLGSAGAGSAIGALAGGGKGAAIGALSGGVAGLVYDLATRNK